MILGPDAIVEDKQTAADSFCFHSLQFVTLPGVILLAKMVNFCAVPSCDAVKFFLPNTDRIIKNMKVCDEA